MHTDTVEIIWSPISQVDLGEDLIICDGESLDISASGFTTYEWSPNSGIDCSDCETITVSPAESTTYYLVAGKDGCYSVDSIRVDVGESTFNSIDTSICLNETITIGNVDLQVGDSQTFFLLNSAGCDSTLQVNVTNTGFEANSTYIDTTICANETFSFAGINYSAYETDTIVYQTIEGCDSTYFITIGGIETPVTQDTLNICFGESIEIFGVEQSVSGNYSEVFNSVNSCDSTHITTLIVNEEIVPDYYATPACPNEATGSITFNVSGGSGTYSYTWADDEIELNTISNLNPGEYVVTITDSNNCQEEVSVVVDLVPEIDLIANPTELICYESENGAIDLSESSDGLEFGLDAFTFQETTNFDSLSAGTYTIYAMDQFGCMYSTTATIEELDELVVELPEDTTIRFGEQFLISSSTNSNGSLSYFWPVSEGLDCIDCPSPITQPHNDILYTIEVVDEYGCVAYDEILIRVTRENQVFVPNIFSPNEDDINDYFLPVFGPGVKSILKMNVFDRWGGLLYEKSNVDLSIPSKGWDGTSDGVPVNPGVYVYIIELEYIDGVQEVLSGDITIVR